LKGGAADSLAFGEISLFSDERQRGVADMRLSIAMLLIALPLPALAGECDHWTAKMEEDEGGSVMMAHICAPAGKASHELYVQCGAPGELSFRYTPVAPKGYPPTDNYETKLEFSMDQEMFTYPARFEEMDGAIAAYVKIDTPFISVLQTQKEVMLADTNNNAIGATFTLKGSKAALAKVIADCAKQ
jgi:hypothetical protein